MYCRKCGTEIKMESKFCRKCGAEQKVNTSKAAESFYIAIHGENKGPFSIDDLQQMYQDEELNKDTYVCKDETGQWVQANEIESIQKIFLQGKKIKCDQCGNWYSEREEQCPSCKIIDEKKKKRKILRKHFFIALASVLVILVIVAGGLLYNKYFYLGDDERAQVEEVVEKINSLGQIDENSEELILQAEILYARMMPKSQRQVNNIDMLKAARAEYNNLKAQEVIIEINKIGDITKESGDLIANAENKYVKLLDSQKRLVDNAEMLMDARNEYDQLCAQEVIDEIEKIGAIAIDKKSIIDTAWKDYSALTQNQKELVTNSEFLEKAEKEIAEKMEDIEEAQKIVRQVMDAFNYEMTGAQIFSLVGNNNIFELGIKEMLSRGFLSDMLISSMSGEKVSYADLNYLSKSAMNLLEEEIVEEFVHSYSMGEPRFANENIIIEIKVTSLYGGIVENMTDEMLDDLEKYVDNNRTTLSYMKKYYSETEFYRSLLDMWISSYGSTWLREMDSWKINAESKQLNWKFTLSKKDDEWKVVSIEIK